MSSLFCLLLLSMIKNSISKHHHSNPDESACPCWSQKSIVNACSQEDDCVSGFTEFYEADMSDQLGLHIHCGDNFFRIQATDKSFNTITCSANRVKIRKDDYIYGDIYNQKQQDVQQQCQKSAFEFANVDNSCETQLADAADELNCGSEFCSPVGGDCLNVDGCSNDNPICLPIAASRGLGCADIKSDCTQKRCWIDDDCPQGEFCWIGAATLICSDPDAPDLHNVGLCAPRCDPFPAPVALRFDDISEQESAISLPIQFVDENKSVVDYPYINNGQVIVIGTLFLLSIILNIVLLVNKRCKHKSKHIVQNT